MAALYYRKLTIDHTKVGANDSANFPVFISVTDATLKTVANSGNVQNASGFDIQFYSDAARTSKLSWEVLSYDGSAGTIVAFVKVATLSHTTDTDIYMEYGNSSISTFQGGAASSTFSNSFVGVWHMNDNAATTAVKESVSAVNGVFTANTSTKTTTSPVGKGLLYSGTDDCAVSGFGSGYSGRVNTFSCWAKVTAYSANGSVMFSMSGIFSQLLSATQAYTNTQAITITSTTLNDSAYHLLHFVGDATTVYFYADGVLKGSVSGGTTWPSGAKSISIGDYLSTHGAWALKGAMAEARFSSATRNADWITAEYNNQNSPSTFFSVGAETSTATSTGVTKSAKYCVTSTPSAPTKTLTYGIRLSAALTKSLQYIIGITTPITKTAKYCVLSSQATTKSLQYGLLTTTDVTKSLRYTVLTVHTGVTKSLQYGLLTTTDVQLGLIYSVQPAASITTSLQYTVSTGTALTKSLQYAVIFPTEINKTAKYCVVAPVDNSLAAAYRVVTTHETTKSLSYSIDSFVSVNRTLKYTAITTKSFTLDLRYRVWPSEVGDVQRPLRYRIVTVNHDVTKALRYAVKPSVGITRQLRYVTLFIVSTGITKTARYVINLGTHLALTAQYVVIRDLYTKNPSGYSAGTSKYGRRNDYRPF